MRQSVLFVSSFLCITSGALRGYEIIAGSTFIRELRLRLIGLKNAKRMTDDNNIVFDTASLIRHHGYLAEEHSLTTEDGYGLKMFRIPGSSSSPRSNEKPVVFLQHGLLWSSDAFVLIGSNHDLSFMLVDAGYDVWMGNVRGNTYGKNHRTRNQESPEFWDFSYHEMGTQDLPAMIDYVLKHTAQNSLYFVGHSMGATIAYVLLSLKPEYNEKIKLVISLAPVTFWRHKPNRLQKLFKQTGSALQKTFERNELHEILSRTSLLVEKARQWCREGTASHTTCLKVIFGVVGEDREQLNASLLPYLFSSFPAGTSLRTIVHFHQNMVSGDFHEYDFKSDGNLERYGQTRAPFYPLQRVTSPVALIYGKNDAIVTAEEMYELAKYLGNVTILEAVPFRKFNHMDFIWARDVRNLLYERILQLIKQN